MPKQLSELKEGEPGTLTGRPLILYSDGIFDMFHVGHAKALQQAKQAYPNTILKVGCCSDELTHRMKGLTVLSDKERYEALSHCKWVDEVIEEAPWIITDSFISKHNIDYVCHDALPYGDSSGCDDIYSSLKKQGKFYETQRTNGISTSDIITRIISEYDTYIRRNLERGCSAKDMKVHWTKETQLLIEIAFDKAKDNFTKTTYGMNAIEARIKMKETIDKVETKIRTLGEMVDFIQKYIIDAICTLVK